MGDFCVVGTHCMRGLSAVGTCCHLITPPPPCGDTCCVCGTIRHRRFLIICSAIQCTKYTIGWRPFFQYCQKLVTLLHLSVCQFVCSTNEPAQKTTSTYAAHNVLCLMCVVRRRQERHYCRGERRHVKHWGHIKVSHYHVVSFSVIC